MKSKMKLLIITSNVLLLALIGLCLLGIRNDSGVLLSQQTAKVWAGDSQERFAQVSCFFPENALTSYESIFAFRKTIDSKIKDVGLEEKTEGTYWTDCYSAADTLTVEGYRDSTEATVIGVGGDYFLFHPYKLESGSYIYDDDVMKDRVVLDYNLAWKLFGGTSLEGMTVEIGGKPYYVAGVIRRETDQFTETAYSGEALMFMDYSALASLNEETGISAYEIAMPDPISNFAKTFVTDAFKTAGGVIVENSTRYDFSSILRIFTHFGERSIVAEGVRYPYWENAARISEVYVARLYFFIALLSLFPLICLIILSVRLIKRLIALLKHKKFEAVDAWEDRYARQAAWKKRRAQKRISKNLKRHDKKQEQALTAAKPTAPKPTEDEEKAVALDVENIVREIMEEISGVGPKQ